jgi:hypothetical protein
MGRSLGEGEKRRATILIAPAHTSREALRRQERRGWVAVLMVKVLPELSKKGEKRRSVA